VTLFGPCAKRRVQAVLIGASGKAYAAENVCLNPQAVCPRAPGEGYDKCKTICRQVAHAELQVLDLAGADAHGGRMQVSHWYACDACAATVKAAGVADVAFTAPQDSERTMTP
jgi:hypothetical protein